jgi:CubicO group peptidase (beta-lactamase class C family)
MHLKKMVAGALLVGFQLLVTSVIAASSDDSGSPELSWPTKTWEATAPEAQGMDSGALAELIDTVGTYRQDSLLIVRHGKIVAEAYYAPYAAGIRHDLRSVTKSIIGTLTAIELRNGLLDSVDHPIIDLFPDKQILNVDDNKRAMTVQTLLDMTSGIDWQEKSYTPDETIMRMYQAPDRAQFVLSQPMSNAPGTHFYYNSGNLYVLSALITKKTGQSAFDYGKKELFEPLGIGSVRWGNVDAQGVTDGEAGLFLTPRGMAKIGYLYLHDGVWDGKQIIPSSWVARAREGRVEATYGLHYANLWWSLPEKGAYMALGRHSQMILVLRNLDIVAAMTGILRDDEHYPIPRLIDDIARSVKSDNPLPSDPLAQSLLAASVRAAATDRPSPVGQTPDLAKVISGKSYQFDSNVLRVKTLLLDLNDVSASWEYTIDTGKADQAPQRFAGLIGLDGIFRISPPASYGIDAVKGRWLNAHTFAVERRILGHSETQNWTLSFDDAGKKVDVSFENTDGYRAEFHGAQRD